MNKNIRNNNTPRKMNHVMHEENHADSSVRRQIRNFLRSAIGATDPDIFYFSMNGMVMPLSRRA